ncbi:MAG: Flp pilus assembly complex ATPase component TadA [Phycisphaeraceae bacterium]|nr:Flp pilus assembly complex ATPase component TadA [Phycisphaeraceae bacterium]
MEQDVNTQGEPETGIALRSYSGADPFKSVPAVLGGERFAFTQERLSEALLQANAITAEQLSSATQVIARSPGRRFMDVVLEKVDDQAAVQAVVAHCAAMRFEELDFDKIESVKQLEALGADFCLKHGVIPIRPYGSRLLLGVVHADDLIIVDEAQVKLGQSIKTVLVTPDDIAATIDMYREGSAVSEEIAVDEIIGDIDEDDVEIVENEEEDLDLDKDQAGSSPVIRFVNYLIYNAVKEGASDIHIEPQEKKLQVRYRIDGVLFDAMNPPGHMKNAIVSRLKIMANLDIAERRIPQDGRIRAMVHGRKLDLRMSTLPMVSGEKVVLRILDTRSIQVNLDDLGMSEDMLQMWKHQIKQPHGIVLVTGPTGSGKTTTLYSSLNQMDRQKLNISTVEDPVEYHLGGINQTQTHESIGMSFAGALRALLRQDPDVIMVGEIRDGETSKIAIQASLTGHLVLSTLHTNDAPSAVTRLINIGVEPYLIGTALNAVVAQRLVRKICDHCKEQAPPDDHIAEHLAMQGVAIDQVWGGKGCDKCRNTGYSGRVGLYEMLLLNDQLRDRIAGNPNVTEFRRMCIEGGMVTLRQDGFQKVAKGQTTVDEVLRVTEASV